MTPERIFTENAPRPIGPYSQAVRVGQMVYTAGQIGFDADGSLPAGVAEQTRLVVRNLKGVLEAAGSSLERVIKTTIFLHDLSDFAIVNEVYAEYFGFTAPARSTVQVARLPKDALVEIEAIAIVDTNEPAR